MGNVKLSILIATYNSCQTLKKALNSVKGLTFNEWECVVVDGKSSDDTVDIIRKYSASDSRFRFISEKDNGIYDALNKGVRMATGEWIYVLGSDDELTPDGLGRLLAVSDVNDVVYGNVFLRDPDGNKTPFIAKKHTALKYVMNCSHQAVIVRKSVIDKLNGFNLSYKIRADFDLLQRAYLLGYKFKKVNAFIAYYMTTGFSSMASRSTHIERLQICQNNNSTRFPRLLYYYQESKFIARLLLYKIGL